MDLSSDTSHLYDDSKFGDVATKLDIKNRLETKHQNLRETRSYELTARILDRSSSIVARDHEREMQAIKNGLQDIYVKTPYFKTFWKMQHDGKYFDDGDSVKEAVVNRILGRTAKPGKIETVPEHDILQIKQKSVSGLFPNNKVTVRRSKSEPNVRGPQTSSEVSDGINYKTRKHRFRSGSLSTLQLDRSDFKTSESNINAVSTMSCIFPLLSDSENKIVKNAENRDNTRLPFSKPRKAFISDAGNTNKDLAKYDPIVYTKSVKRTVPVEESTEVQQPISNRTNKYLKKANHHSKNLDSIYTKRRNSLKTEESSTSNEQSIIQYRDLPENATLRAHFITQTNSRRFSQPVIGDEETANNNVDHVENDNTFDLQQ